MRGRGYPPDARGRFLKDATTAVVHHCGMEPTINFITLGVPDLQAARRFYVDGLGWNPTLEVEGEVVFIQVSRGQLLGLWWADKLEADAGAAGGAPPAEYRGAGMVLSHNVGSEEDVLRVLEEAAAAGGTILRPAERSPDFDGLHGHFADPAGFRWEVAHNPGWRVDADGRVHLGPVP
jgi:catechol 2,3-dioxygenase-like lactoylglutathione lyase family enzyme